MNMRVKYLVDVYDLKMRYLELGNIFEGLKQWW